MRRTKISDMSVDELVEKFTAIALAQDEAMLMDEHAKYNRLFNQMDVIGNELKSRAGDQRRALLPLYDHRNAQVRLTAAIATLAVAPDAARRCCSGSAIGRNIPKPPTRAE